MATAATSWPVPSPEEQVFFLRNVQRLLNDGQFTASYKFALLLALADLAVLKGEDTGAPLELSTREIAEKFIEFYWQQCRPFQCSDQSSGSILGQNKGKQAAVLSDIIRVQGHCGGSLFRLRQQEHNLWESLLRDVRDTVCEQPLRYLQNVGGETVSFLYEGTTQRKAITLKTGVAYCFRAFYGLLRDLIQGAWVRFVQRLNGERLGNLTDLGTFLFGRERGALEAYRDILLDVQGGRCFYCHKDLHRQADVDHFIPWCRYPTDLGHNFVLSHPACNNAKSDHLAAEEHLTAWAERNRTHQDELHARLLEAALPHDLAASIRISEWAYEQTERAKGQVWLEKSVFRHLGPEWRRLLVA